MKSHDITELTAQMIDVGTLLRTISKSEDYDIPEIANYLSTYKVENVVYSACY